MGKTATATRTDKVVQPYAKWETGDGVFNHIMGTCQNCGCKVPAVALAIKRLPFGRGEIWACKHGC